MPKMQQTSCRSFFFAYCGLNFDIENINKIAITAQCGENPTLRGCFLTTVHPTSATGTGGDNGNKSAKEDVILSRKG